MRTELAIKTIANGIYGEYQKSIASFTEVRNADFDSATNKVELARELVKGIETIAKGCFYEGVGLPHFLSSISFEDEKAEHIYITVRSGLKAPYKYKNDISVALNKAFIKTVSEFYSEALFEMFYIEEAIANVEGFNVAFADILKEAGITYSVEFVCDNTSKAKVLSITDTSVVINLTVATALQLADLDIFSNGDEYTALIAQGAREQVISGIQTAQTPAQFVKSNVKLIKELTGITTQKRIDKLIRASHHRKAENLKDVKAGIGYFEGKEGDKSIFALVTKSEDGSLEVTLSPIDINTLEPVEFDVLKAIA